MAAPLCDPCRVGDGDGWLRVGGAPVEFKPGQSQALLARLRTWIDTRTDQMIIVGSLIVGFWLIAKGSYLIAP